MRTLANNAGITPVLVNSDFPDGAIINETPSQEGTAVINEIYNDVLANLYKLLRVTGTTPNATADSEATTYQILGALQKLPNVLNDVRQNMNFSLSKFNVPIAIDLLPDGYFLIVKATQSASAGTTYQFKGTGSLTYDLVSPNGFSSGDTVLLIINHPTNPVLAYSLSQPVSPTPTPLTFDAADILGSDPFFYLPLSGTTVPQYPKYLTMYIKNGDSDMQTKMVFPAYIADTRIITGFPNPGDWGSMEITLYFA